MFQAFSFSNPLWFGSEACSLPSEKKNRTQPILQGELLILVLQASPALPQLVNCKGLGLVNRWEKNEWGQNHLTFFLPCISPPS